MMRYAALAAALALSGCSGVLTDPPPHKANAYETVQMFYRPMAESAVREWVDKGVPQPKPAADRASFETAGLVQPAGPAPIEIAELRPSIAPQPGDWSTCVRAWKDGRWKYFAVFFGDRAVNTVRPATMIDRCEDGEFSVAGTAAVWR
jgi:hypothetical protein